MADSGPDGGWGMGEPVLVPAGVAPAAAASSGVLPGAVAPPAVVPPTVVPSTVVPSTVVTSAVVTSAVVTSAEPADAAVAARVDRLPSEPVRRPGDRPTIKDVAALAGVSSSAAARAISGTGYVGQRARQRVLTAAAELGYVPHVSARYLKTRVTRAVGVLVDDVRNPVDAALLAGVLAAAREHGLATMVADRAVAGRPVESVLLDFVAFSVAGVVCVPATDGSLGYLTRYGIRAVEVAPDLAGSDATAAGRAAVERLARDLDRDPGREPPVG